MWRDLKHSIICLLVILTGLLIQAQDQRFIDSLTNVYQSGTLSGIDKLELLRDLSFYEKADIVLEKGYADELVSTALRQRLHDTIKYAYVYRGYRNKGWALSSRGEFMAALKSFTEAQRAAIKANYLEGQATAKYSIAGITAKLNDEYFTSVYYEGSISDYEKLGDREGLIYALANAGDAFLRFEEFGKAYSYLNRAGNVLDSLVNSPGSNLSEDLVLQIRSYINGNLGIYNAMNGKPEVGKEMLSTSIADLMELKDFGAVGEFQVALGKILLEEGEIQKAKILGQSALDFAEDLNIKFLIGRSNKHLAKVAEQEGNFKAANDFQKISTAIEDEMTVMREQATQYFYEQGQQSLSSENEILRGQQKINRQQTLILLTAVVLLLIALLTVGIYGRYRYIRNTNKIISEEKDRSDGLLLNILPKDTAEELKSQGHVQAKKYNQVTVMFTDFLGFTRYADHLPPEELVKAVDYYFSQFDLIMEKHGIEKIKTVGDAYLCASGLPDPSLDHAERIIRAALDIIDLVKKAKHDENDLTRFDVRIGISTGPVVAGVVGSKKFAYDIWGDTVNCASRMETNSEPMCINVSEYTYELTKDMFSFIPRGKLEVKNKGKMQMYFVDTTEARKRTSHVQHEEGIKLKS